MSPVAWKAVAAAVFFAPMAFEACKRGEYVLRGCLAAGCSLFILLYAQLRKENDALRKRLSL